MCCHNGKAISFAHAIFTDRGQRILDLRSALNLRGRQHGRDMFRRDQPGGVYGLMIKKRSLERYAFAVTGSAVAVEHSDDQDSSPGGPSKAGLKRRFERQADFTEFYAL